MLAHILDTPLLIVPSVRTSSCVIVIVQVAIYILPTYLSHGFRSQETANMGYLFEVPIHPVTNKMFYAKCIQLGFDFISLTHSLNYLVKQGGTRVVKNTEWSSHCSEN